MPQLSKLEFSKTYKISRPTLDRYIASGRISTTVELPSRNIVIDTSEADRIGLKARRKSGSGDRVEGPSTAHLQTKLEMTERLLAKAESELERANENAENWRKQLATGMALLTDQRDKAIVQADMAQKNAERLASQVNGIDAARQEAIDKRKSQNERFKQLAETFAVKIKETSAESAAVADKAARLAKEASDAKAELEAYKSRGFFKRLFG